MDPLLEFLSLNLYLLSNSFKRLRVIMHLNFEIVIALQKILDLDISIFKSNIKVVPILKDK